MKRLTIDQLINLRAHLRGWGAIVSLKTRSVNRWFVNFVYALTGNDFTKLVNIQPLVSKSCDIFMRVDGSRVMFL